jgi:hypothetical protein
MTDLDLWKEELRLREAIIREIRVNVNLWGN